MATYARGGAQTEFVYCCGALTEILKCGPSRLVPQHKILFLVIPGNPGVVGFYKTFMERLYGLFECRHPVWAISHAGHCVPPDSMDMVQDAQQAAASDVFGISGQIDHKLAFLKKQVPTETQLIMVGHSIGCYIILEMMKRNPQLKVLKAIMLFPTIERMAVTPQGKVMTPVLCQMRYLAYLPLFLLSLLPETLKSSLIKLVFAGIPSLDQNVIKPTVGLLSGDCAANAMYMGGQEMKRVLERDNVTIRKNLDKLIFYYGATDHWCPVQFYHDIKHDFPAGDFKLCTEHLRHAFVLDSGSKVAEMIAEWLIELRA
ncbi:lipid droplet-associated hydrolase [Synchiropus splendidus]|uniref:lipid droplet-associated hydrolase n=1 Tax=Synchiropus splendidus TaxID=270530 RepID=UPI00237E2F03|nr:lipid droplet-associated hydrolase [Synchiropus splendidus]